MPAETDPTSDDPQTPPAEDLPENDVERERAEAEAAEVAGELAVGETVEGSAEESPQPADNGLDNEPEPIAHSLSGKPIYEILGEETSPEGEKFVKIKTMAPGRLPNGEPDWGNVSFGEVFIPMNDLPPSLLAESNPHESDKAPSEADTEHDTVVSDEIKALSERYGIPAKFFQEAEHDPFKADVLRRKGINWGAEHSPVDPDAKRILRSVPSAELTAVNEARGTKITPENLRFAALEAGRGNLRPADRLQGLGLDLGISRLDPPDPVILNSETGRKRLEAVEKIVADIKKNPGELRKTLRRPGELPLDLHRIPLARMIGMRLTAWRVARKEIRDRPMRLNEATSRLDMLTRLRETRELTETEKQELAELPKKVEDLRGPYDDGLLRIGLPRYRQYRGYIKRLDQSVKSHRKDLFVIDRHALKGPDAATKRENLAYRIFDGQASVRWLDKLVIVDRDDPEAMHDHDRFKKASGRFHDNLKAQQRK